MTIFTETSLKLKTQSSKIFVGFAKAAQGPVWAMGCCNSAVHGKSPLHHFVSVLLRICSFRTSATTFCSNAIANVLILSQGLGRGAIYDHDPREGHATGVRRPCLQATGVRRPRNPPTLAPGHRSPPTPESSRSHPEAIPESGSAESGAGSSRGVPKIRPPKAADPGLEVTPRWLRGGLEAASRWRRHGSSWGAGKMTNFGKIVDMYHGIRSFLGVDFWSPV